MKKSIFIVMLLVMSLLVACGGNSNGEETETKESSGQSHGFDIPDIFPDDFPFAEDAVIVKTVDNTGHLVYATDEEIKDVMDLYVIYYEDQGHDVEVTESEFDDNLKLKVKAEDFHGTIRVGFDGWSGSGDASGMDNGVYASLTER